MKYTWNAVHDVLNNFGDKALDLNENVRLVFEEVKDGVMVFSKYDYSSGDVNKITMTKEYFIRHLSRQALRFYNEKYGWR